MLPRIVEKYIHTGFPIKCDIEKLIELNYVFDVRLRQAGLSQGWWCINCVPLYKRKTRENYILNFSFKLDCKYKYV